MAPTKEPKEKKLTPDESAKLILDYLRTQNRPYSATDISQNLNNRVAKAAATKLLKDMHERKEIDGKASGKQIVYFHIQDDAAEDFDSAMQAKEAETERLRNEVTALKAEEKELRLTLRTEDKTATLPELKSDVEQLETEKAELALRLEKLRSGTAKPVDPEKKALILMERKRWAKTKAARAKIRKEMWAMVLEAIEKEEVERIKEEIGIEGQI
ncbi:Putative pairing protein [Septoria linicola]|uniref:Pairing protein n=1 Tax=Septoria linicola TaxID=215465 RepID=A0A9Q9B8C6_9PEZI|nr:putative pairing protein [Septoria linicola]USW59172.1 Putative pairing protein [Septoria linicola]